MSDVAAYHVDVLATEVYNTSHKNAPLLGLGCLSKQSVVVLLLYGTDG